MTLRPELLDQFIDINSRTILNAKLAEIYVCYTNVVNRCTNLWFHAGY